MRLSSNFYKNLWKIFLFVALESLSVFMVVKSGTVQHYLFFEKIRNIQYYLWNSGTQIRNYLNLNGTNREYFLSNLKLISENDRLRKELDRIKGEEYVNSLLLNDKFDFTWAKVVKSSFNGTDSYIVIDKGLRDGIAPEMGVIMPNGVVGIIMRCGPDFSYIKSFLNTDQQVSAKISTLNAFGTMRWNGMDYDKATLHDIPQHIKVNIADTVYTSGLSSIYPNNIPLGTVERSSIEHGTHQAVDVKLFLNYRNIDYVIIVRNPGKREIDSLTRER